MAATYYHSLGPRNGGRKFPQFQFLSVIIFEFNLLLLLLLVVVGSFGKTQCHSNLSQFSCESLSFMGPYGIILWTMYTHHVCLPTPCLDAFKTFHYVHMNDLDLPFHLVLLPNGLPELMEGLWQWFYIDWSGSDLFSGRIGRWKR
jgi:hypothetical protein